MRRSPESAWRSWLAWALTAVGLLLVDIALVRYTSYSDRRILSRWSPAHFTLIVLVSLAFALTLYRSLRARAGWSVAGLAAALGFVTWALSLAVDSLSDPGAAGRIADVRIFAGTAPVPILVEWVALALVVVAATVWLWHLIPRWLSAGSRRSRLARNLLASLVSLMATLLVLEALCRVLAVVAPAPQGFPTRAQVRWSQRHVRLNSLGYRDVEHPLAPPAGRTRILLVGDSVGHGFGINDVRHRVSERLQEDLNRGAGGRRFEVINAARPDTHTADQIAALPRVLAFKPKYVLLLYVFNDIEHVSRPARPQIQAGSMAARLRPLSLLVSNSALAEQVFVRLSRSSFWFRGSAGDPYMDDRLLQEHLSSLERFFRMCQEAGAEARLVPFDLRVVPPNVADRHQRLERGAQARGIPVWSLERAFDGHAYSSLIVNHLDHHPNELANRLAARVIVDRFRAEFDRSESTSR